MGATENNHPVSVTPPKPNSKNELILGIILSLLQWVLPMNPWLACFIWIFIGGLSGHLIWRSQWTKDSWSETAKIVSCIGIAAIISWQALDVLKNDKQQIEKQASKSELAPQKEPLATATEPTKPPEPAQPFHEEVEPVPSVKPIPRKAKPPVIKKDIPTKPKEIIPDKPEETIPIQARETIADVLIRKYTVLPPEIIAVLDRFIPTWIQHINSVRPYARPDRPKLDLQRLIREIGAPPRKGPTVKEFVDEAVAEAAFTLRCLESEGYARITETTVPGKWYAVDFPNLEFEFVPEKLNEFVEGL